MMRDAILAILAITLLGASTPAAAPRTPKAQAKLDKLLAGRVPGAPEQCVASNRTKGPIGIDDRTILFRDGPRMWRNDLQAGVGCSDLTGRRSLMIRGSDIRVCRGDTVSVIDLWDGTAVGGCILGDFIPYAKP